MVFEVLGQNLLTLIVQSKYRGIHIDNVRLIMRQVRALPDVSSLSDCAYIKRLLHVK